MIPHSYLVRSSRNPRPKFVSMLYRGIQLSPSAPIFLRFNMPSDLNVALLKLTSGDTRCMTLSVQNLTCPIYDLDTNVLFEGMWQVTV